MFDNFQYASMLGNLLFLIVWIILFLIRRDLRNEILIMSLIVAPMGPISEIFYLRDYWQPEFFNSALSIIEELLFGFTIGGITAVIYEVFFGKKYLQKNLRLHSHSKWLFVVGIFGITCIMFVGSVILGFNSMYVSIAAFLIIGIFILIMRRDLLKEAFFSGLFVGILMFLFYFIWTRIFPSVIQEWWLLKNISGVIILGVPLEELMWGFSWGFAAGPAYTFINGLRFKK